MMKKITCTIILLCLAFLTNAQVSLTVKKTSDLPTIDGVVDPIWGEVEANAILERADGVDASDYTATFKALWSGNDSVNDSIYFLIELTDDKFVSDYLSTSDGSGGIMALDRGQDDGFDVMFNPGLAGLPTAGYGSPYRAGIVTTEADPEGTLWFTVNQDSSNSLTDNTHKAHTVNGTKYVFEFAMGLWDFEVNIPTVAGYQFGVDIRYNDDDANIPTLVENLQQKETDNILGHCTLKAILVLGITMQDLVMRR